MRPHVFLLPLLILCADAFAAPPTEPGDCATLVDDAARLRCYDQIHGRASEQRAPTAQSAADAAPLPKPAALASALERRWELEQDATPRRRFFIAPHKPNYILPVTYATSINTRVYEGPDRELAEDKVEAKFQISFKAKLWDGLFGDVGDLWFAYTQLAFWQVYNNDFSAPFRETNYEPELILGFATDYNLLGLRGRYLSFGFNHQSNGRSDPLSRSWNRLTFGALFERNDFALLARAWYRLPEDAEDDNNPDIEDYMGNGELWGFYKRERQTFALMLRNNFDFDDNRSAVELDWSFPLFGPVKGYLQYFYGYGESLIDYNQKHHRLGLGLLLTDWL